MPAPRRPEPPDPMKIVDAVLGDLPESVLDATEEQFSRLFADREEIIEINARLHGGGSPRDRAAMNLRGRVLTARRKRCEAAMARLDAYFQPYIDRHKREASDNG